MHIGHMMVENWPDERYYKKNKKSYSQRGGEYDEYTFIDDGNICVRGRTRNRASC